MAENDSGQELDLEVGGQKVRAKGYRLIDLIWLPMIFGIAYICLTLYQHDASAQKGDTAVAKQLTESNQIISNSLRESNKTMVDALKENNANTVQALRELTLEQRKATSAIKEIACLSDPSMRNRGDAREFCKRMARDDR